MNGRRVVEWDDEELRIETTNNGWPLKAHKAEQLGAELLRLRWVLRKLLKKPFNWLPPEDL